MPYQFSILYKLMGWLPIYVDFIYLFFKIIYVDLIGIMIHSSVILNQSTYCITFEKITIS